MSETEEKVMRNRKLRLILNVIMSIAALLGAALPPASWAQATRSSTDRIPDSYFGLHVQRIVQTQPWYTHGDKITPWPSIKYGSWRLWDAYVAWPNLEPERGKWNFKTLDRYVDLAEKAGIDLVLP